MVTLPVSISCDQQVYLKIEVRNSRYNLKYLLLTDRYRRGCSLKLLTPYSYTF